MKIIKPHSRRVAGVSTFCLRFHYLWAIGSTDRRSFGRAAGEMGPAGAQQTPYIFGPQISADR